MKTIRIRQGAVAATFSIYELESLGCRDKSPSREVVFKLCERAFAEICEHPRRVSAKVFVSDTSLLLFAEERPDAMRLIS